MTELLLLKMRRAGNAILQEFEDIVVGQTITVSQ